MLPKWHILFGGIFFLILYFIFDVTFFNTLIFFLASVLIDADHYAFYVFKKKDLSLKNAYNWFIRTDEKYHSLSQKNRKNYYYAFCIFHGIEFIILIFLLAYIFKMSFLYFAILGFLFHLSLDIILIIYEEDNLFVVTSLFYNFFRIKNKKILEINLN